MQIPTFAGVPRLAHQRPVAVVGRLEDPLMPPVVTPFVSLPLIITNDVLNSGSAYCSRKAPATAFVLTVETRGVRTVDYSITITTGDLNLASRVVGFVDS